MRKSFLVGLLVLVGLVCAQIPYGEYEAELAKVTAKEAEAEQYKADGEFGKAYAALEEAKIMQVRLYNSRLGAVRYFLMAKEWVDRDCSPGGRALFDQAVALFDEDYVGAAIMAVQARQTAMHECGALGEPVAEEGVDSSVILLFLIISVGIVLVFYIFFMVKRKSGKRTKRKKR